MSESNTDENKEENNYIDSDEEYGLFNSRKKMSCNGKQCSKRRETIYIDGKQFKIKKRKNHFKKISITRVKSFKEWT